MDYAPVERLARLCRATPDELVELHRLWVRADVSRGRKTSAVPVDPAVAPAPAAATESKAEPSSEASPTEPKPEPGPGSASVSASASADEAAVPGAPPASAAPSPPRSRRPRRITVIVGAAVAAVAVAVTLVTNLSGGDRPEKGRQAGDTAVPSGAPGRSGTSGNETQGTAFAPTVVTAPHTWEGPCTQHYLLDREPEQVPPPPTEQDAPGWIAALDAVPGGDQLLRLTVQGTGKQTVVLEALHVRVVSKKEPLAWNDYVMGVGCGGEVSTKAFAVDLDAGRPTAVPVGGQRTFSYKTSESDPVIFNVAARARAHDVSWYLELVWSSGEKHGTLRVDDDGRPFRTSGNLARPAYAYPLGWTEWIDNDVDTGGR